MLEKLRVIFTIPELRQKILLTLGLLAIYRVGWQVPLPIIDPQAMAAFADPEKNISSVGASRARLLGSEPRSRLANSPDGPMRRR